MRLRKSFLVIIAVLALVAAACGGSDGEADDGDGGTPTTAEAGGDGGSGSDSTTPSGAVGEDAPDATTTTVDGGGAAPTVTEMGSFTVNDTEFAVTFLNRCIPFEGPDSDVIDLQPLAQGQGAQLNLYGTNDFLEVSVQGSAIREMFGSIAFSASGFDDPEMQSSIDGDRWTGSGTLNDALDEVDPVTVAWDVMVPDEIIDCSL